MDKIAWNDFSDLLVNDCFTKDDLINATNYVDKKASIFFERTSDYYLKKYGITLVDYVSPHNKRLLKQVILDAFSDLKRIKEFHDVGTPNVVKRAAYISYWWNIRKPFPVNPNKTEEFGTDDFSKLEEMRLLFFNEFFLTAFAGSCIFDKNNLICETDMEIIDTEKNDANDFLFYQFCYRTISPKYIEAFLSTFLYHPRWKANDRLVL